jgi:hypothetical protein
MSTTIEKLEQDVLRLTAEVKALTFALKHYPNDGRALLALERWEDFQKQIVVEREKLSVADSTSRATSA